MAPKNIFSAVILLCIALGLGILRAIIGIPKIGEPTAMLVTTVIALLSILLGAFLIYMIYKGKNWARITFLVLFIVGIVLNIGNIIAWLFSAPILLVIYILEIILTIIALVFMFQDKSSKWFEVK